MGYNSVVDTFRNGPRQICTRMNKPDKQCPDDKEPLGQHALDRWVFQTGEAVHSEVLFVFGTPHRISEFAVCIRDLWDLLALKTVVISGYNGEAQRIAMAACQLGVPSDAFALERHAANTCENVAHSAGLLRRRCHTRQLHVLSKLHAGPRSLLTLKQALPGWHFHLHTENHLTVCLETWRSNDSFRGKVVEELRKVATYGARGHLSMPDEYCDTWETFRTTADGLSAWHPSTAR